MLTLMRTDSENKEFIQLVGLLDQELAERDGADHAFYDQFNKIRGIKYAIILQEDGMALGCGALKEFDLDSMEIKRMFVLPAKRGYGHASSILKALEVWASELKYKRIVLETGQRQHEAIGLYEKKGYQRIPNYGQYANIPNSLCFEKILQ